MNRKKKSRPRMSKNECRRLKKLRKISTPLRERFFEDLQLHDFAPRTIANYTDVILKMSIQTEQSPCQITNEQLRDYFLLLEKRGYSQSTLGILHAALTFLYRHTVPREMPFLKLFRKRRHKTLPVVLSQHEVRKVLASVKNIRYQICLKVIYSCGLRVGEALSLTVESIDAEQSLLYVFNGKGGKPRTVPLPEKTLFLLRRLWATHRHPKLLFPAYKTRNAPRAREYYGAKDVPFSHGTLRKYWKQALIDSGCRKNATLHSLRHSYATHLLEEGVDIFTLKEYLGHSCISNTLIYTHLSNKLNLKQCQSIDQLMSDI
jgi:site-specific recombinase XerD